MGLEVRKEGALAWAALTGEVTIYTVGEIKAALTRELAGCDTIDLANLGGALGDPLLFTAAVES